MVRLTPLANPWYRGHNPCWKGAEFHLDFQQRIRARIHISSILSPSPSWSLLAEVPFTLKRLSVFPERYSHMSVRRLFEYRRTSIRTSSRLTHIIEAVRILAKLAIPDLISCSTIRRTPSEEFLRNWGNKRQRKERKHGNKWGWKGHASGPAYWKDKGIINSIERQWVNS